jgi:prepilin-type N-terminal cleavage/methylation domain-containing protein
MKRYFSGNLKPETINLKLRSRGFALIELMLVVIIVGMLATVVLDRMLYYQERAEKAVMDATLAAIKMGLQVRLAELIITNRQAAVAQLERDNPMLWLDEPPSTYRGEYRSPAETGNWYFAADARQLVYVPNKTSYLQWNQADSRELRFQVRLRYDDIETVAGKVRAPTGIAIVPAQPYRWF